MRVRAASRVRLYCARIVALVARIVARIVVCLCVSGVCVGGRFRGRVDGKRVGVVWRRKRRRPRYPFAMEARFLLAKEKKSEEVERDLEAIVFVI